MKCPCYSGLPYNECCKDYHDGENLPPTALALMRSRYSAYALEKAKYVMETTHPDSPYFEKDLKKWEKAVLQFSRMSRFIRLQIIDSGEDWVHFIAHLEPNSIEEKSHFQKENGKWLYMQGI